MKNWKKIIISLVISFFVTQLIGKYIFIGNTPRINPTSFQLLMLSLKDRLAKTNNLKPEALNNNPPTSTSQPVGITPNLEPTKIITMSKPTITMKPSVTNPTTRPTPTSVQISQPTPIPTFFIAPTEAPPIPYPASSSNSYGSLDIISAPADRPAVSHPDLNLSVRGYVLTSGSTSLVDLQGDTDLKAPQFTSLLDNDPHPPIIRLYKVYDWDWSSGKRGGLITDPEVSLFGIQSSPGEPLHVLKSGYNIGEGFQVMVLYATRDAITMKYTREDNVISGYTLHVQDIWVDPNLVSSYEQSNAAGRGSLPALRGGDIFGVARTNEVKIAMRDTGTFMNILSRKDWWK